VIPRSDDYASVLQAQQGSNTRVRAMPVVRMGGPGACLTDDRLLRPRPLRAHCALTFGPGSGLAALPVRRMCRTRSGIFRRSFPLHSARYARETISGICSLGVALATAIISQTGSSSPGWEMSSHGFTAFNYTHGE